MRAQAADAVGSVAHCGLAAAHRSGAPNQQQGDRHQRCGKDRPTVEYVNVTHERSLVGDEVPDVAGCAALGARRRAKLRKVLRQIVHRRLEARRRLRQILNKARLMKLRALHQFGVGERHADAAAEIARDIDQRRGLRGFFAAAGPYRRPC